MQYLRLPQPVAAYFITKAATTNHQLTHLCPYSSNCPSCSNYVCALHHLLNSSAVSFGSNDYYWVQYLLFPTSSSYWQSNMQSTQYLGVPTCLTSVQQPYSAIDLSCPKILLLEFSWSTEHEVLILTAGPMKLGLSHYLYYNPVHFTSSIWHHEAVRHSI